MKLKGLLIYPLVIDEVTSYKTIEDLDIIKKGVLVGGYQDTDNQ